MERHLMRIAFSSVRNGISNKNAQMTVRLFGTTPTVLRRMGGGTATFSFRTAPSPPASPLFSGSGAGSAAAAVAAFPWVRAGAAVAAVGLGAVALDAAFNGGAETQTQTQTQAQGDTLAANVFVREYLNATFRYVGGALALTAAAAVALHRTPAFQRLMATQPLAAGLGGFALTVACIAGTCNTDLAANPIQKHILFASFAVAKGAMLSPLFFLNPTILVRAGIYTAAIVGSLSYVAATSKSDRFLYLGGPLFGGLCIVAVSSLSTLFLPATSVAFPFLHSIALYGGLALFGGFVLYDTQKVIQHGHLAASGATKRDPVNESISLYLDFINIFVRMVQILAMSGANRRK
ncbi:inhibitor of apoptosis-promoting Bax1-domain-containing protein [Obelidium mucronatum]|nr:inhibitor of apoptosis-promoting Bax1-domain-containing protein [Obelidium mucronatum]